MSSSLSAVLRSRPIREVRGWPLTLAELSLVLLNLSAVLGLRRLFEDWEFLTPALIALFGAHLTAVVLRRLRLGSIVSVLTSMVVMVFVTTNARYGETTNFIVPTADTWSAVGDDIALAWDEFAVVKAPAEAVSVTAPRSAASPALMSPERLMAPLAVPAVTLIAASLPVVVSAPLPDTPPVVSWPAFTVIAVTALIAALIAMLSSLESVTNASTFTAPPRTVKSNLPGLPILP